MRWCVQLKQLNCNVVFYMYIHELHNKYCFNYHSIITFLQMLTSVFLVRFLKNIVILHTIVTLMQTVPIPKDHFTAHVIRGILEMELHALVNLCYAVLRQYQ